jgi:hypothetical protein
MKPRYILALVVAGCMFISAGVATALDVAISTQAGWFSQEAADREMDELKAAIEGSVASVELFTADDHADLATWVKNHTNNGEADILVLCGQLPSTIYEPGNVQADDSLAELFLDAGNAILNTGDYMFYVVDGAGTNADQGLVTMMDIETSMWDDDTAVMVTDDGKNYTPSLQDLTTDRPFHLDEMEGTDWEPLIILAQNDAGTRADPGVVINKVTGGMLGIFFQTASQDDDPRAEVMSEFILSYYSTTSVTPASRLSTSWGAIKSE